MTINTIHNALTLIGKSRKQNPKIGKSPTVFQGNKIQKNFKNPHLGTSPAVFFFAASTLLLFNFLQ